MTRHYADRKPPVSPKGAWLKVSHELTWASDELSNRDDLVVKMAPDAGFDDSAYDANGKLRVDEEGNPVGDQHPGVTFPDLGIVEINPAYLPEDVTPESMKPLFNTDHQRYPVVWGILGHEAAHAHFTKWPLNFSGKPLSGEIQNAIGAAMILEESRIEKKHLDFRPQDQQWLGAMAGKVALDDSLTMAKTIDNTLKEHPELKDQLNKVLVARAAALVLARVDAGSIEASEDTEAVEKLVKDTFGKDAGTLREIWREAQRTADDDSDKMLELGRRWYELTGDAGEEGVDQDEGGEDSGGEEGGELGKTLRRIAQQAHDEASGESERQRQREKIIKKARSRQLEARQQQQAKDKAASVFNAGKGNDRSSPITGYRAPTTAELTLARTTRKNLQAAYVPERAITNVTRELPPGRLSVRTAQQLDAQRQMGLLPDAEPFTYKDRRHVVTPPLKVGIIQDVSGSQDSAAAAAASGAWSLARGALMLPDAEVAMVTFGDAVHAIIEPREKLSKVPVLRANSGTNYFLDALKAIEGELDLMRGGSARLLVILTDWYLNARDITGRDAALKRLAEAGVKILAMVTDGDGDEGYVPAKMNGVHLFKEASGNYSIIPRVIAREAVNALKK